MRGFVAPTDYGWYRFLQARPELREVNFWRPSQTGFGALEPGELFFFKLKAPHNAIAGFGLFSRAEILPVWEAWDVFGAANGAGDQHDLLARLQGVSSTRRDQFLIDDWITCIAINEPVFFPQDEWVDTPASWQREIVSGKGYDLTTGDGRTLYETCVARARALATAQRWTEEALARGRHGEPHEVRPRLGQSSFRLAVLDAYEGRCAVTGERSLPVIEASHIRPFAAGGEHAVPNGLPLRRDIHRLYDLGFVTVRPDHAFAVSSSLRDAYANGRVYYQLGGSQIRLPASEELKPQPERLEWHYDEVFRH